VQDVQPIDSRDEAKKTEKQRNKEYKIDRPTEIQDPKARSQCARFVLSFPESQMACD
jgi:hypothetical protein